MIVNHNINNLSGGVSKQPDETRFDNQVEDMVNFVPTISNGLKRRNRLQLVNTDNVTYQNNMPIHSYDRGDGLEKYGMIIVDNSLRIYDDNGNQKTINISGANPLTTWNSLGKPISSNQDARFLTVGDTTWLLNRNVVAQTTGELTNQNDYDRAFYWAKRSFDDGQGGGYTYTVEINGVSFSANNISSEGAMASLSAQINQRYSDPANNPVVFPDYIRAVAIGSILHIYVAKVYAPDFRLHPTTTNKFVRVQNEYGQIEGYDVEDYFVSFMLITNKFKLYMFNNGTADFFYLSEVITSILGVYYYSNESQAISGTSPVYAVQNLFRTNGTEEIEFTYSDSWGNQASIGWKLSTAKIDDLPSKVTGFTEEDVGVVAITGTDRDSFTSYYLKWNGEYWTEAVGQGIEYKLDKQTLPAKIVRQSDGTFVFGFVDVDNGVDGFNNVWNERVRGDDDSNPIPSFVGSTISNMFFFKNRLGFTSEENVILSEAGKYYNFFATTVIELVDSDPIDASVDSDTVSIIRNVNAVGGSLTLWSDNAQFVLSGGDILSPATTRIGKSSSYFCDNSLAPIVLDNEIMFFRKFNDTFEALSYSPASINTDNTSANVLSAHIERYLPSTIDRVVASSGNNMVFFTDSVDRNKIYVYKYFIENNKKIMSAWFEWTFTSSINSIEVLGNMLYILCDSNKICVIDLEVKDLSESFVDVDTSTGLYTNTYESRVRLSRFNIETKQGTRIIREPFYVKNVKLNRFGTCDMNIINMERGTTKTILSKFVDRKIFVGGNSEKVYIEFKSSYNDGCNINAISIEGILKTRSRNV